MSTIGKGYSGDDMKDRAKHVTVQDSGSRRNTMDVSPRGLAKLNVAPVAVTSVAPQGPQQLQTVIVAGHTLKKGMMLRFLDGVNEGLEIGVMSVDGDNIILEIGRASCRERVCQYV